MSQAADRLKRAREGAGYDNATDAARRYGWNVPTYLSHENGSRGITASKASDYGRAFRVSPEWILYGRDRPPATPAATSEDALVPVHNVEASAGHGSAVFSEEVVSTLAFPRDYLSRLTRSDPRNLKIIGVKGDSMLPTLRDDDIVMLDTTKRDPSYDGLFVVRDNGDGLLVKRIGRASRRGFIMLISDNRDLYPPIEREINEIEVLGKVLWVGQKV